MYFQCHYRYQKQFQTKLAQLPIKKGTANGCGPLIGSRPGGWIKAQKINNVSFSRHHASWSKVPKSKHSKKVKNWFWRKNDKAISDIGIFFYVKKEISAIMKYHFQWALISSSSSNNIGHHSFIFTKVVSNKNMALKKEAPLLFSLEANWDMLLPSLIPWKMEEKTIRAAEGIYFRPKSLPHSLLNSAYFIFSRKEEGKKLTYRYFLQVVSPEVELFERREVTDLHREMCDFVARCVQLH